MPRKKNLQLDLEKKSIHKRTKRLFQITFRTEEQIYNNKKISLQEAQQYLEELSHYKNQKLDVRTSQVVEKLIRIMNEVIQDEFENAGKENEPAFQVIPIEQPIFVLQKHNKENSCSLRNEYMGTHHNTAKQNMNSELVLELSDADEDTNMPQGIIPSLDVSVETAISNLNIHETSNVLTGLKEPDQLSQSILMDFDDNACNDDFATNQLENTENISQPAITLNQKELNPLKKRILSRFIAQDSNGRHNNQDAGVNFKLTKPVNTVSIELGIPRKSIFGSNDLLKDNISIPKSTAEKTVTLQQEEEKNDKKAKSKLCKVRTRRKKKPNHKCDDTECITQNKPIKKRRGRPLKNNSNEVKPKTSFEDEKVYSNIEDLNQVVITTEKVIRRKCVEVEDLSWVEDIKFVRIVEKDEFCPVDGYDENFWTNLDYPPDWDDLGFS